MTTPNQYPRRILVAVSGLSPAILTETLYALATNKAQPFVPTEIHLITTSEGKERAVNSLLKGDNAAFHRLCQDYGLQGIDFGPDNIHLITNHRGEPMADIRLPEDNERAADCIIEQIREFTRDEGAAVHVSIAGGRKTMGYYVGYALSLLGREQDRLSHVLVEEDFEKCPTFFYPTRSAVTAVNRDGKYVDFSEAKIHLAEIPFVCMRLYLPEKVLKKDALIQGERSFSELVRLAQSTQEVETLVIDPKRKRLVVNGIEISWSKGPSPLAFYLWILEASLNERPLECPSEGTDKHPILVPGEPYIRVYERYFGSMPDKSLTALNKGLDYMFFHDKKAQVNKQLKSKLGESLGRLLEIRLDSTNRTLTVDIPGERVTIVRV